MEWSGNRAGFLATAGYGVDPSRDTGISRPRPGVDIDGQLTERNNYQIESGEYEVQWGALVAAGLEIGNDHAFQALSFFNRTLEDGVSRREGRSEEGGGLMEKWQLSLVTRHVFFNQIQGDHRNVGNTRLRLRWNLFGAMGSRSEPDRRTIIYGPDGGLDFRWLAKGGSGDRFYSDLGQVDSWRRGKSSLFGRRPGALLAVAFGSLRAISQADASA